MGSRFKVCIIDVLICILARSQKSTRHLYHLIVKYDSIVYSFDAFISNATSASFSTLSIHSTIPSSLSVSQLFGWGQDQVILKHSATVRPSLAIR